MKDRYRILLVDDDRLARWSLREKLREQPAFEVDDVPSAEAMLVQLPTKPYDLVFLDIGLPGMSGVEALQRALAAHPGLRIVMATANDDEDTALKCLGLGAFDYICKPFDLNAVSAAVAGALGLPAPGAPAASAAPGVEEQLARFVGECDAVRELKARVRKIIASDASTLLIQGESGTGKDLLAKIIHQGGRRASRPFMDINCTALPANLLESELFGYEKGAFTDAKTRKLGLFEMADNGTLLLDEIGDMEPALQVKLLRALEERRFKRVGGTEDVRVDSFIIATTNANLQQRVAAGRFRKDLFFRLNVIPLTVPPLREREGDIPVLIEHFIGQLRGELNSEITTVSWGALSLLCQYPWPGNVRELKNLIERLMVMERGPCILASQLPPEIRAPDSASGAAAAISTAVAGEGGGGTAAVAVADPEDPRPLQEVEREAIKQALDRCHGNLTHAGQMLGLHRDTLRYRARKLGVLP